MCRRQSWIVVKVGAVGAQPRLEMREPLLYKFYSKVAAKVSYGCIEPCL